MPSLLLSKSDCALYFATHKLQNAGSFQRNRAVRSCVGEHAMQNVVGERQGEDWQATQHEIMKMEASEANLKLI